MQNVVLKWHKLEPFILRATATTLSFVLPSRHREVLNLC